MMVKPMQETVVHSVGTSLGATPELLYKVFSETVPTVGPAVLPLRFWG